MNKTILFGLLAIALPAQAGTLLAPRSGDQVPRQVLAAPLPAGDFERQPLAFTWALDPGQALETPAPHRADSREYWTLVDGARLAAGVDLDTTAPGAVIRLSPVERGAPAKASALRVSKDGRVLPQPQSFQRQASADQLQAAGMPVPDGSVVVQLADEHGQGRFRLQLDGARDAYLVHVYEPNSPYRLQAQAARPHLLAGEVLEVAAELGTAERALGGAELGGLLVSPSGRSLELGFEGGIARVLVPADAATEPGLWEVQLFAGAVDGGQRIERDARTAVQVSRPTARLAGGYGFAAATRGFSLPLQVAAPGRYALTGTLYATGPDGVARPVLQTQSAAWLEPGQRSLALAFGGAPLPAGYGAPFELRDLQLQDQTRMGVLETRALAAREAEAPATPARPRPGGPQLRR